MKNVDIKEIIAYLIVGVCVTIISLGSYYLLTFLFFNPNDPIELQISNVLSWIFACTAAYFMNRIFVFKSKDDNLLKEGFKFYLARLATLLVDMALMFIFVSLLKYNDKIVKVFVQVVVILSNYIVSKFVVFKK